MDYEIFRLKKIHLVGSFFNSRKDWLDFCLSKDTKNRTTITYNRND